MAVGVEPSSSQGFGAPNPTLVLFRVRILRVQKLRPVSEYNHDIP